MVNGKSMWLMFLIIITTLKTIYVIHAIYFLKVKTDSNHVLGKFSVFASPFFHILKRRQLVVGLWYIFTISNTKLWRSSKLKYLNRKRNMSDIKFGRKYSFDLKAPCRPAPLTVAGKVAGKVLDVTCNVVLKSQVV